MVKWFCGNFAATRQLSHFEEDWPALTLRHSVCIAAARNKKMGLK
jgi:hypothetical protein